MIPIKRIAKLANLNLTEQEESKYETQLRKVISYISHLEEVDTGNVDLNDIAQNLQNVMSDDVSVVAMTAESALYNSRAKYNNYFKVDIVLKNKVF